MAIVTISHEMGAGGSVIGRTLAERLEYRYVDQDMIARAARQYGCLEDRLTHLDETRPSLLERFDAETRHYLLVLQSAVLDVAEQGDAVIMGRSGQVLLKGIAHALRVFVRAPFDLRVRRVIQHMADEGEPVDRRAAAELVRRTDQDKAGRTRYLFDVSWSDPALYDVVINTETLRSKRRSTSSSRWCVDRSWPPRPRHSRPSATGPSPPVCESPSPPTRRLASTGSPSRPSTA